MLPESFFSVSSPEADVVSGADFAADVYKRQALIVENADGSTACDLRYRSHHIFNGKYKIPGLPAVYADETESQTLEIVMEDAVTGVEVTLQYGVLPDYDVITRSEKIVYRGEGKICIRKAQSACLDFVQGKYDLLTFYGRHAMERTMQREPVTHGSHAVSYTHLDVYKRQIKRSVSEVLQPSSCGN